MNTKEDDCPQWYAEQDGIDYTKPKRTVNNCVVHNSHLHREIYP